MCVCVCVVNSESRVGDVYSKASSFVDYVRKAVTKLGLDETKVGSGKHFLKFIN